MLYIFPKLKISKFREIDVFGYDLDGLELSLSDWVACVTKEDWFWEELEDVDEPLFSLSSFVLSEVEVEVQLAQYSAINLRYSLHPSAFDSFSPPVGDSGSCDNKNMQGNECFIKIIRF